LVDVLILPVGGNGYTLDATGAATLTRSIDPKVVIPVHYAESGINYEVPQDTLETFVKELGAPVEEMPKFKLKTGAPLPAVLTTIHLTRA
jgi:L-ascorbate metabolism protein UlaG (beta-lactamase superfamily)